MNGRPKPPPWLHADNPTQPMRRTSDTQPMFLGPDPRQLGPWTDGHGLPIGGPNWQERGSRPQPFNQPRRRRTEPKQEGGWVRTSTAVTFALLAFAFGFLGGVGLVAAVILQRQ